MRPRPAAGTRLTVDDDGAALLLHLGESADLVLAAPVDEEPVVAGDAVELVPVLTFAESPFVEWELRARRPGTATVRSARPPLTMTVVVEPRP
jgi:hypothetical protein